MNEPVAVPLTGSLILQPNDTVELFVFYNQATQVTALNLTMNIIAAQ